MNKFILLQVAKTLERLARILRREAGDAPELVDLIARIYRPPGDVPEGVKPMLRTCSQVRELVNTKYGYKFTVTAVGRALKAAGYVSKHYKQGSRVNRLYAFYRL